MALSHSPTSDRARAVTRLVGIYDAEGSLRGELSYVVRKLAGRGHCALCDITHGWSFSPKTEWSSCVATLPVPFELVHLDGRSPEIRALTEGAEPCVVAVTGDGAEILLDAAALESCRGRPSALVAALTRAASERGLVLHEPV